MKVNVDSRNDGLFVDVFDGHHGKAHNDGQLASRWTAMRGAGSVSADPTTRSNDRISI